MAPSRRPNARAATANALALLRVGSDPVSRVKKSLRAVRATARLLRYAPIEIDMGELVNPQFPVGIGRTKPPSFSLSRAQANRWYWVSVIGPL
jgi:hypothetical protein